MVVVLGAGLALCPPLWARPSSTTLVEGLVLVVVLQEEVVLGVKRGRSQLELWRCWEVSHHKVGFAFNTDRQNKSHGAFSTGYGCSMAPSCPLAQFVVCRPPSLAHTRYKGVGLDLADCSLVHCSLRVPTWWCTAEMQSQPSGPHTWEGPGCCPAGHAVRAGKNLACAVCPVVCWHCPAVLQWVRMESCLLSWPSMNPGSSRQSATR